ncbi:MAG: RES family NAD+ phosphorylase [Bacteroidales bacterium]|jgi:RES domain-containing protein|nr:RES family NAD+ phosphorylase [Bacteroidales bacterium]
MIVYRLSRSKYSADLSGKGAEKSGGRWNSKGVAMVYTSNSRALCTAEVAVHIALGIVPSDYELVTIEIPDDSLKQASIEDLPADWRSFPHPDSTQKLGDRFIMEGVFLVLKVPSVVVQGEYNFLINPKHEAAKKVRVIGTEPFLFDKRLFIKF